MEKTQIHDISFGSLSTECMDVVSQITHRRYVTKRLDNLSQISFNAYFVFNEL